MRTTIKLALVFVVGAAPHAASASVEEDTARVTSPGVQQTLLAPLAPAEGLPDAAASLPIPATGFFPFFHEEFDDFEDDVSFHREFDDDRFFFDRKFDRPRFFDPRFDRPRFFEPKARFFPRFDRDDDD
jgi:hypothetical protein